LIEDAIQHPPYLHRVATKWHSQQTDCANMSSFVNLHTSHTQHVGGRF